MKEKESGRIVKLTMINIGKIEILWDEKEGCLILEKQIKGKGGVFKNIILDDFIDIIGNVIDLEEDNSIRKLIESLQGFNYVCRELGNQ